MGLEEGGVREMVEWGWRKGRGCEGKVEWGWRKGRGVVGGCRVGCATKIELKIWDQ